MDSFPARKSRLVHSAAPTGKKPTIMPNRFERYVSWTHAGFNNLDHNRDRQITSNEWHFDLETFRRVDRNRDGAFEQTEFLGSGI